MNQNVMFLCNAHKAEAAYSYSPPSQPHEGQRLLSKAEVLQRVPVSFSTLYGWMQQGTFPRPRIVGPSKNGKVFWTEESVDRWISDLPEQKYKRPNK